MNSCAILNAPGIVVYIDAAETEGRQVLEDYEILRRELEQYNPELLERPYLVAANKMDLPSAQEQVDELTGIW